MKRPFLIIFLMAFSLLSLTVIQIELELKTILNKKIEIKIPTSFDEMSDDMAKKKYPSENRPTLIYTNESGGINVAFNKTKSAASQAQIPAYHENFVKTYKSLYPSAKWISEGTREVNGKQVGYMELVTPAIDSEIYNLVFYTDMDSKLLICTFNCLQKDQVEWSPTAWEILESLKVK